MNCITPRDKKLCSVGTENTGREWHFYVISGEKEVLIRFLVGKLKSQEKTKLVHTVTTVLLGGMSKLLSHSVSHCITCIHNIVTPAGISMKK